MAMRRGALCPKMFAQNSARPRVVRSVYSNVISLSAHKYSKIFTPVLGYLHRVLADLHTRTRLYSHRYLKTMNSGQQWTSGQRANRMTTVAIDELLREETIDETVKQTSDATIDPIRGRMAGNEVQTDKQRKVTEK